MSHKVAAETPKVELATKEWTLRELMDIERRLEKAFHEQTQYLGQKIDNKLDSTLRWMIGLIVTMTIAIILAVLFKE